MQIGNWFAVRLRSWTVVQWCATWSKPNNFPVDLWVLSSTRLTFRAPQVFSKFSWELGFWVNFFDKICQSTLLKTGLTLASQGSKAQIHWPICDLQHCPWSPEFCEVGIFRAGDRLCMYHAYHAMSQGGNPLKQQPGVWHSSTPFSVCLMMIMMREILRSSKGWCGAETKIERLEPIWQFGCVTQKRVVRLNSDRRQFVDLQSLSQFWRSCLVSGVAASAEAPWISGSPWPGLQSHMEWVNCFGIPKEVRGSAAWGGLQSCQGSLAHFIPLCYLCFILFEAGVLTSAYKVLKRI